MMRFLDIHDAIQEAGQPTHPLALWPASRSM
jgi:hypothetical protein